MSKDIKVLFYGDSIRRTSGYGRVMKELATRLAKDPRFYVGVQEALTQTPSTVIDGVTIFPAFGFRGNPFQTPFIASIVNHLNLFNPHVFIPISDAFVLVRDGLDKIELNNIKLMPYIPVDSNVLPTTSDRILKKADRILVQSEFGQEELTKAGYNSHVFRHGVNPIEMAKDDEKRKETRLKFGIDDDTVVFLFVGRNSQRKRIDRLIRGYAEFVKANPNKKTLLFMHGSDYDMVEYNINERIEYEADRLDVDLEDFIKIPYDKHKLGMGVPFQKIKDLYNACDWTISAASGEGTGLLSLEGFSIGKPTIYPENSNWKEIIGENNERGLSVKSPFTAFTSLMTEQPICSIDDMAKTINNAYKLSTNNKELYDKMSEACQEWILENADWDKIVEELKDHIFEVLK